jgi:hypothetical protein
MSKTTGAVRTGPVYGSALFSATQIDLRRGYPIAPQFDGDIDMD